MTTDKNNSCHLGAAAPAFKSATRLRGARKSCPVVSKRTYRQVISDGDTPRKGFCYAS